MPEECWSSVLPSLEESRKAPRGRVILGKTESII